MAKGVAARTNSNEKGSALVVTLIFMVVVSISLAQLWHLISVKQTISDRTRMLNSRDMVVTSALRNSRVASFYYYTFLQNSPANNSMFRCLLDDGQGVDCVTTTATGAKVQFPIMLVNDANQAVIGSATSPVSYDTYGNICTTPSESCPFQVYGTFTANCENAATSCAQAYTAQITIHVGVHPVVQHLVPRMVALQAKQNVSISDFKTSNYPMLPPPTAFGTPITTGAGPGGFIKNAVYPSGGPTVGGGVGGGSSGATAQASACGAGEGVSSGGGCGSFSF